MRFDSVTVSAGRSSASDDDVVNLLLLQRSLKIVGCVSVSGAGGGGEGAEFYEKQQRWGESDWDKDGGGRDTRAQGECLDDL